MITCGCTGSIESAHAVPLSVGRASGADETEALHVMLVVHAGSSPSCTLAFEHAGQLLCVVVVLAGLWLMMIPSLLVMLAGSMIRETLGIHSEAVTCAAVFNFVYVVLINETSDVSG